LRPGATLLDVGSGPGTITADLARLVAPGRVVGLDAAAEVVVAAARDHGASNVEFVVGDATRLDYPDGSFDFVHAHQVLQHLADPVGALSEMRRVCRSGGAVAVRDGDYAAMTWWPASEGLDQWRDIYRTVARSNGGEPDAGRRLVEWCHAAGLDDLVASASAWCFATPEDRRWWSETWATRISDSPLADRAKALGIASQETLDACAAAWRDWAEHADATFFVPHGEVVAFVR
jgi:SAM-dependent methyltransferase